MKIKLPKFHIRFLWLFEEIENTSFFNKLYVINSKLIKLGILEERIERTLMEKMEKDKKGVFKQELKNEQKWLEFLIPNLNVLLHEDMEIILRATEMTNLVTHRLKKSHKEHLNILRKRRINRKRKKRTRRLSSEENRRISYNLKLESRWKKK